jgi:hypothetical protein
MSTILYCDHALILGEGHDGRVRTFTGNLHAFPAHWTWTPPQTFPVMDTHTRAHCGFVALRDASVYGVIVLSGYVGRELRCYPLVLCYRGEHFPDEQQRYLLTVTGTLPTSDMAARVLPGWWGTSLQRDSPLDRPRPPLLYI